MSIVLALVTFASEALSKTQAKPTTAVEVPLADLTDQLKELNRHLEQISTTLKELLKATDRIATTLVQVAVEGPSLEAQGHVERSVNALRAGLLDLAVGELSKAEALDPTRWEVWFAYLMTRLVDQRSPASCQSAMRKITHSSVTELQYCARLIDAEPALGTPTKLVVQYALLGMAIADRNEAGVRDIVQRAAARLTEPKVLTLDNARGYLQPILSVLASTARDDYLRAPIEVVRDQFRSALRDAHNDALRGDERMLTTLKGQIADVLPSAEMARLDLLGCAYRSYEVLARDIADQGSQLREELAPWKFGLSFWLERPRPEPPRDEDSVIFGAGHFAYGWRYWEVFNKDLIGVAVIVIVPIISVFALPWRWYITWGGSLATLSVFWLLHRAFYTRHQRRFKRQLPELKKQFDALVVAFRRGRTEIESWSTKYGGSSGEIQEAMRALGCGPE